MFTIWTESVEYLPWEHDPVKTLMTLNIFLLIHSRHNPKTKFGVVNSWLTCSNNL